MGLDAVAREVGVQLGLKESSGMNWGRWQNFLIAIHGTKTLSQVQSITIMIMIPEGTKVEPINVVLENQEMWKSISVNRRLLNLNLQAGVLTYTIMPKIRTPKAHDVLDTFRKLTDAFRTVIPSYPQKCSECGRDASTPVLINNLPTYVCENDLQKLKTEFGRVAATAAATKPNYPRGIALGLIGALIGATIWAAVGIATGYTIMFLGFITGGIIAYLMMWGAKKVTGILIVLMVLFSLLSTFIGEWLWITAIGSQLGFGFDLALGLEVYFIYMGESTGEALGAYFFTIVPVMFIAFSMFSKAKAAKPQLDIQY